MSASVVVAGVDVGGTKKGFHAVALRGGTFLDQFASRDVAEIVAWCRRTEARIIGVDAPCRWSESGRARPAERELMAERVWCFSTPTRQAALAHAGGYFNWMLNGESLFEHLEKTHALLTDPSTRPSSPLCFETFPQAIACALAGGIVSAKQKGAVRRGLLARAGVDTSRLRKIDSVDAALCAVAANYVSLGCFKTFGEPRTGFVVVPDVALPVGPR